MQKINLAPHIVVELLKFKTSGNLISLEVMPDNANQRYRIFGASLDI